MQMKYAFAVLCMFMMPECALAEPAIAVDLAPVEHQAASLTVINPGGSLVEYSPSELEQLPTYQIETKTPWREESAVFEGVMLFDLLSANGLIDEDSIRVTAENDYSVDLPRELWRTVPVMVATRADGNPLSRRVRGPFLFVIDSEDYEASEIAREHHLVWMVAKIEPGG